LLGLSKRGDSSLRQLLIHGARATLRWARTKTESRSQWIRGVLERRGWNRTAVAVANKHARIVWALRSRGGVYGESTHEKAGTARPAEVMDTRATGRKQDE
jgi:transposase